MSLNVTMMDSLATIFRPTSVTRDGNKGTVQVFTVLAAGVPCSQQQASFSTQELYKQRDAFVNATLYFCSDPATTVDDLASVLDGYTQQTNLYLIEGQSFPVARGILWQADGKLIQSPAIPATVVLPTATSVTTTTASLGATVSSTGNSAMTTVGVAYSRTSVNAFPRIGRTGVSTANVAPAVGAFAAAVTGLTTGTRYSFAPYAITAIGTTYGQVLEFVTL